MEEFYSMTKQWDRLSSAAKYLDQRLKGITADGNKDLSNRTILHGDFKCENVLFDDRDEQAAAYDF